MTVRLLERGAFSHNVTAITLQRPVLGGSRAAVGPAGTLILEEVDGEKDCGPRRADVWYIAVIPKVMPEAS